MTCAKTKRRKASKKKIGGKKRKTKISRKKNSDKRKRGSKKRKCIFDSNFAIQIALIFKLDQSIDKLWHAHIYKRAPFFQIIQKK